MKNVFLSVIFLLLASGTAQALDNTNHGLVYYCVDGAGSEIDSLIAERYSVAICGQRLSSAVELIKSINPDFKFLVYNSATDNYVIEPYILTEHNYLQSIAAEHGWNFEEAYLHYYDDTELILQGEPVFIPGWPGGSATSPEEARVPVYYSNLSRRVVNFSTPVALMLNKLVFLKMGIDTVFVNTNIHPDGIFNDNCAYRLWNTGTLISGGHVTETPDHSYRIDTNDFQNWHWQFNLSPFLTALKDTLETAASWSPDGKRKYLCNNISNAWTDTYAYMDVADILLMEWQYNPLRSVGINEPYNAWRRDSLATEYDIQSFYVPTVTTDRPGYEGEISYGEALLGDLSWFLTTRTNLSIFYPLGSGNPCAAGWDTLVWRGCMDVANEQLGDFMGDPYMYTSGIDPLGYNYKIWARNYTNGLVLLRNRGEWSENFPPETAVEVTLPGDYYSVDPEGNLELVNSVFMINGVGRILLNTTSSTEESLNLSTPMIMINPSKVAQFEFALTTQEINKNLNLYIFDTSGRLIKSIPVNSTTTNLQTISWKGSAGTHFAKLNNRTWKFTIIK